MASQKNNIQTKNTEKDINYYKKKFWQGFFYGLGGVCGVIFAGTFLGRRKR